MERQLLLGVKHDENQNTEPKLYKRRWLMLILLTLLTAENISQWLFYSAIDNIIKYHFNISSFLAQLLSLNNFAVILLFGLPAIYVVNKTDLKAACLICGFLSLTALWVKFFGTTTNGFHVSLIGQVIASFGTCFVLPLPAQLASTWFGVSERSTATSIAASGVSIGMGLAYVFSVQFVPDSNDHGDIQQGLRRSILTQAILCSITIILMVFAYEIRPASPPSYSEALIDHGQQSNKTIREHIGGLMRNKSYVLTFLSFGIMTGVFYSVFSLLNDIILWRFPDKEDQMGWMGFLASIVGIPGMFVTGLILDKTKAIKTVYVTYFVFLSILTLAFGFAVKYCTAVGLPFVLVTAFGFVVSGITTVGFVLGAELTYPDVSEVLSSGVLLLSGQFFAVLILGINSYAVSADSVEFVNWFFFISSTLALILTPFIKPDYRRLAKDNVDP